MTALAFANLLLHVVCVCIIGIGLILPALLVLEIQDWWRMRKLRCRMCACRLLVLAPDSPPFVLLDVEHSAARCSPVEEVLA